MAKTTPFQEKIYSLLKNVPKGSVTTYKEIGKALEKDGNVYRAIGQALSKNPYAPEVPCHRVVKSDGTVGGFKGSSSGKEVNEKTMLLVREGVEINGNTIVNFEKKCFKF